MEVVPRSVQYNQKFSFGDRIFSRNFFALVEEYTVKESLIEGKTSAAKHICKIEERQKYTSIRRVIYACSEANAIFNYIRTSKAPTNT